MGGNQPQYAARLGSGVSGLDEILNGGLPRNHHYLLEGESGTGKTTIGMQFLLEGLRAGEKTLLITLAEGAAELREVARSHGWVLDGVEIFELPPLEAAQQLDSQQSIFPTAEFELSEATDRIVELLRQSRPQRVVFDSVSELRLLAADPARFRRQMLALSAVLDEIEATSIFVDRPLGEADDRVLDSLVHGIIHLERRAPDYGATRRRLEVSKMRGMTYQGGWLDFGIFSGGVQVYPRPRSEAVRARDTWEQISSGLPALDMLLSGGLELGTACLIGGASGTGKSSVAGLYVHSALQRGIPAATLLFDERPETLYKRTEDLHMPLGPYVEQGLLTVRQIETGEISPGEFAQYLRDLAENAGVRVLVIDSLTGYLRAMPQENLLMNQMHDLLNYLSRNGVLSIMVVTYHGLLGETMEQGLDLSYLSDTVINIRHFEAGGALHQAISVVKKRHGRHERTIRELLVEPGGVRVGEPLVAFRAVLTGNPEYEGRLEALMQRRIDEIDDGEAA